MSEEPAVDVRGLVDGRRERLAPEDLGTLNGAHHLARYRFAAEFAPGRRVADLCCGTGYGTDLLLSAGATDAVGIDLSAEAIEEARRRFPGPRFSVGDAAEPIELDADLRVCFEGIEHIPNPDRVLRNLRSGLPSDGVVLISTPNAEVGPSDNPHHVREFTPAEFREMLATHFSTVTIYFQWWFHDPFAPAWGLRDRARAFLPGRFRPTDEPVAPLQFRPVHEAELTSRVPHLRYGRPAILVAVCHQ